MHDRGSSYALDILPYDVQRIEVLEGPQGTLYGANSVGGAIKYVLTTPSLDKTEIRVGADLFGISGAGDPAHATRAMELGLDGVLLNTAVATAVDPTQMAEAFALAVRSGRQGYLAGMMAERDTAVASTPTLGTPFWHEVNA